MPARDRQPWLTAVSYAYGLVAAAGFLLVALEWPRRHAAANLAQRWPVDAVVLCAVAYLVVTAGLMLRHSQDESAEDWEHRHWTSLAAHVVVLAVAVWIELKGLASLALLIGLITTLAVLVTVSGLGIVAWSVHALLRVDAPRPPGAAPRRWPWLAQIQLLSAVGLAAAAICLERSPLPHTAPPAPPPPRLDRTT